MNPIKQLAATISGILLMAGLSAGASAEVPPDTREKIETALERALPEVNRGEIGETPIEGVYQVEMEGGAFLFVTADGDHIISGELYRNSADGLVNLSEAERKVTRRNLLAEIPESEMIVFSPEGETKAVVNVFTDVDCGYCRKLHQEVPELNSKGVEIRYLAFPRAGINSPGYDRIASAWCNDDPQQALTALKSGKQIETNVCEGNPVAREYELGERMGVRGTPALVLNDGTMIPGYRPADELIELLGIN